MSSATSCHGSRVTTTTTWRALPPAELGSGSEPDRDSGERRDYRDLITIADDARAVRANGRCRSCRAGCSAPRIREDVLVRHDAWCTHPLGVDGRGKLRMHLPNACLSSGQCLIGGNRGTSITASIW